MSKFFICNREKIDSKIKSLTKTGTSNGGWSHFYEVNGEQWVLTQYHSEYHGGGISVLKRLPQPTIDELIDIALSEMNKDDIAGASLELSDMERIMAKILDRSSFKNYL